MKWQDSRRSDNVEDRRQNSVNSMGSPGALYRLLDFCWAQTSVAWLWLSAQWRILWALIPSRCVRAAVLAVKKSGAR